MKHNAALVPTNVFPEQQLPQKIALRFFLIVDGYLVKGLVLGEFSLKAPI